VVIIAEAGKICNKGRNAGKPSNFGMCVYNVDFHETLFTLKALMWNLIDNKKLFLDSGVQEIYLDFVNKNINIDELKYYFEQLNPILIYTEY
jgi:hypothetical protein